MSKLTMVRIDKYFPELDPANKGTSIYLNPGSIKDIRLIGQSDESRFSEIRLDDYEGRHWALKKDKKTMDMLKKYFNFVDPDEKGESK